MTPIAHARIFAAEVFPPRLKRGGGIAIAPGRYWARAPAEENEHVDVSPPRRVTRAEVEHIGAQ